MEGLKAGSSIDILDTNDVYCPCIVRRDSNGEELLISYLGWDSQVNLYKTNFKVLWILITPLY
jgi:hypothetical protein